MKLLIMQLYSASYYFIPVKSEWSTCTLLQLGYKVKVKFSSVPKQHTLRKYREN
jgi:hypothetical protein